jgi:hypothetical protein
MAFHKAARQWAERQFRDGLITAADLSGVSRVVHAKRIAPESGGPSTYPSDQDSPAALLAAPAGISVLWGTPDPEDPEEKGASPPLGVPA